jgi:hypothetical protein
MKRLLAAARHGLGVLGGAWLTAMLTAGSLVAWACVSAPEPVPVGWIMALVALAALPLAPVVLALYVAFRARWQPGCRPWQYQAAYGASLVLLRLTGGIYTEGGAGGQLTLLLVMVALHWLLLFLACLGILHVALRMRHPGTAPVEGRSAR